MTMNGVQFQQGELLQKFKYSVGTQARFEQALRLAPWAKGFACSRYASTDHDVFSQGHANCFNAEPTPIRPC